MSPKEELTPIESLSNINTSDLVKTLVNKRLELEQKQNEISSKAMTKQIEVFNAYLEKVEDELEDFEIPELLSVMKTLREMGSDGLSKTSTSLINNQLININDNSINVNKPPDIISSLTDVERQSLQKMMLEQLHTVVSTDKTEDEK